MFGKQLSVLSMEEPVQSEPILISYQWLNQKYARVAKELGYEVEYLIENRVFRMTHKGVSAIVVDAIIPLNDDAASHLAGHKGMVKQRFLDEEIPSPQGISVSRANYRELSERTSKALGFTTEDIYPLVVKPEFGTFKGEGVITNVSDENTLFEVMDELFQKYPSLLVEEYYSGMVDHRLLVLDGKLLAAAERHPGEVVGDGTSTIEELIHALNSKRRKEWKMRFGSVRLGRDLQQTLAEQGYRIRDIPSQDEVVRLMNIANLSSGGYSVNCTERVAKENVEFAVRAAAATGLRMSGVDILCHDISKPIGPGNGGILEVNAAPGVVLHYFPREGEVADVAPKLIRAVFEK